MPVRGGLINTTSAGSVRSITSSTRAAIACDPPGSSAEQRATASRSNSIAVTRAPSRASGIVIGMHPDHPSAVRRAAHGQRELATITPLARTRFHRREPDITLADAEHGVANHAALRLDLRRIVDVLQLAAAAFVNAIVLARRLDALRRRRENLDDLSTGKSLSHIHAHPHAIPRRAARH